MADLLKAEMEPGECPVRLRDGVTGRREIRSARCCSHPRAREVGPGAESDRRRRPEADRTRASHGRGGADRAASRPDRRLKAYLGYLHFGPEDPKYLPYYKIAAKYHLPVIFHTGDNWSTTAKLKYAHPLRVDEVAVDHPDVRFVLAHFGNPWLFDAAEVIFKNTNVWADLSGLFVGSNQEINDLLDGAKARDSAAGQVFSELNRAIAYVCDYKRFLYGSDWPLAPLASYRRLIEALIPEGASPGGLPNQRRAPIRAWKIRTHRRRQAKAPPASGHPGRPAAPTNRPLRTILSTDIRTNGPLDPAGTAR